MRVRALRAALLAGLVGIPTGAGAQQLSLSTRAVEVALPVVGLVPGVGVDESTDLTWVGDPDGKTKITVETDALTAAFVLTVEATGVTRATAAGPVPVVPGGAPQDLVTDIKKARGRNADPVSTRLRYEATAPADAAGEDVHTITYTITRQ